MRRLALLAWLLALPPLSAMAHEQHGPAPEARGTPPALPFPLEIRPRFSLTDHHGRPFTEADLAGRPALAFFGYASCRAICPVAFAQMEEALQSLGPAGREVAALVISVDPARDTPPAMARALAAHPRLTGLTGSDAALSAARAAFQVEVATAAEAPEGPVLAHGSFIYVLGRDGRLAAMLPPILAPEQIAAALARQL